MKPAFFMILLSISGLMACATKGPVESSNSPALENYPPGTYQLGPNRFMVPLENPVQNCAAYRQVSPGQMTIQIIYYQRADGTFTAIREEAQCE